MRESASRLLPVFIFLAAFLQYINTLSNDYAWDDKLAITANDYTKKGVAGLPDIFTKRVSVPYKSEYRPIPQALHAIEYQVFGANPRAGHAFNVFWYALACVLVYATLRLTFPRAGPLFPFLVTALFVVHPLHVEVVANIKGRDEILALVFGLCSLILLVKALETLRWSLLAAGVVCFGVACLSKSNAVTLLPLVPLIAWFRSADVRVSRRIVVALAIIALSSVALVAGFRYVQSTVSNETLLHLQSTVLNNIFLWTTRPEAVVPTALVIVARYLGLFVFPHPLIHLYGYDQIPLNSWRELLPWMVLAGLALVAIAVIRTWKNRLPLVFGVVWFAATYSVYSHFLFFAPDTMADRYMFMPSLGLAIVAVYGLYRLAGLDVDAAAARGLRSTSCLALFAVVLVAFAARTVVVNKDWKNDSTLIHNRMPYMQNNAAAQAIYGHTLNRESLEASSPRAKRELKAAAMRAFTEAIRLYPDFQAVWLAIGKLFAEQGIPDKAELAFIKGQRLEPLNPDAYFCLGTLYLSQRELDLSIPYLEKAVLLDPQMEEAYVMLGRAYLQANNIDNLGAMATTARQWFPGNSDLEALLATYYFRRQDYVQAFELASAVLTKDPRNMLAMTVLSSPAVQGVAKR